MTEWLIVATAVAWAVCWLALGIADHLHAKRPRPPVLQPVKAALPPLPSAARIRGRIDLAHVRAARTAGGRHRRPGGVL